MGKGVATLGSMAETCNDPANLPVGQVIAVGTVFVNKKPAAKKNDQIVGVDTHIVLVPAPPSPSPVPTPLPHPYVGIIDGALSTTVNIMGQPAAMVDSTATNTPSHIPTPPGVSFQKPPDNKAKIILGSFDVLIGDSGASGGGSGSGGGDSVQAEAAAIEVDKGHFLDVKFVDKGGKEISGVNYSIRSSSNEEMNGVLTGRIKKAGLKEGDYEISLKAVTKAEWSTDSAHVGDKVKLLVDSVGIEDGEKAVLQVFIKDSNCADKLFKSFDCKISGGKIEQEWELKIDDDLAENQEAKVRSSGYSSPSFYFNVMVANLKTKSALLIFKDYVELELKDDDGKPVGNVKYTVYLPNGGVKEGYLNKDGYAKEDGLPPGKIEYKYDIRDRKR